MVPRRPGNAGGGKGPDFWRAFRRRRGSVIGDEPGNAQEDPDPSEEALSQGEGGAGIPLLPALRQDLPQRHPEHAYALARTNGGAPGVDGESFAAIEAAGLEEWLAGIRKDLVAKTYRPAPVRRVIIPKPGGGERPLGIPTIRDRVVQTAAKLALEPIFEADLDPAAYGYRPGRGGTDAIKAVHALLCRGFTDVVDADLSKYFDTIPHRELMRSVARRIVDRHVLRLIKLWLKAPVEERGDDGRRRMTGGKASRHGTPQGGVISPLLANLYMNRFLKH
jgi:RNA-directed DNA polymerase